ncbi:transglycosylase domain-containing protein [Rhodococcus aerolatus]
MAKILGCCVVAGVLLAGVMFPVVGGLGLASNRASETVENVSDQLAVGQVPAMTTMTDVAGNPIAFLYDQRRTPVASQDISEAMKLAIVSIEDRRFYEHQGVDWRGTIRAFLTNASSGQVEQGASTLTQQYVKNYLLLVVAQNDAERRQATETTPARKLREIRIALALDRDLGKDEILTRYLNLVPFGNGAYGIEQAARTYFGVAAKDLTAPQSAMLAGMVQSSSALNPYTNADGVLARRNTVLDAMQSTGVLNAADTTAFKATGLGVLPEPNAPANGCIGAGDRGFFCDYALQYLAQSGLDTDQVLKGGYVIKTTLDPVVQDNVKRGLNERTPADLDDIATVMNVVQPGQDAHRVLAMGSSRTYGLTTPSTVTPQPYSLVSSGGGSTFKVFTTAAAMEAGLGTSAMLDTPSSYAATGIGDSGGTNGCPTGKYCVKNYSDTYPKSMSVTQALAQSPNTTFVKLEEATGVPAVVDMSVKLGMRSYATPGSAAGQSEDPNQSLADYWKSIPLGSFTLGPVNLVPLEQANVGATLASGGKWCPPTPIDSVTDGAGNPVTINQAPCEQVVEPGLANTLAVAMSKDDQAGGTSAGAASRYGWNEPLSAKTGTTEQEYSAAFLGFTNTMAASTLTYGDTSNPGGICVNPLRSCGSGTITGGTVPAETFYSALQPIIGNFGPVALPQTDPKYVQGSQRGRVPDFTGMTASLAQQQAQNLGFQITQQSQNSASSAGTVVGQSVTGTAVPGTTVVLYVSNGVAPQTRAPSPQPTQQQAPAPPRTTTVQIPGLPPITVPVPN